MSAGAYPVDSPIEGERRVLSAGSIVELIHAQACARPRARALEYRGDTWSYGRLVEEARAMVQILRDLNVAAGDRVALWADRTPHVVAAALATMQMRAAYVPIDPAYPRDRAIAILNAATPCALLYDSKSRVRPPGWAKENIDVRELTRSPSTTSLDKPSGGDAAYVAFTSGSSGAPKGVVIEHRSLLNYVCWCAHLVGPGGYGAPLFASLGFDHAVTCLWVPLAQGKTVVVAPGLWDHEALFSARTQRYTFFKITPSHARFFERLVEPDYSLITNLVVFGGEALSADLVAQLKSRLQGVRLVNHYGPTEATVGCCWQEFRCDDMPTSSAVPIGRPIWNSRAYVVDAGLQVVEPGQKGELVMAGLCVARGYLGDEDSDRFIDEAAITGGLTCSNAENAGGRRAYRTGDIVERLPAGILRFCGRNDFQLKVAGHRVELDELRHHALATGMIAEIAFDILHGDVDALEAFIVPHDSDASGERLSATVQRALNRALPPAVVPRRISVVHEIVFDSHGKCDISATRELDELRSNERVR
jgi:D-alanine--poly(phosphoribitol) ligase subunit 1